MYQRKDHFYKKAKKEGKVSRAAYKLEELQKKYRLLKKGGRVLDLGAAPGGWLKMAAQAVGPRGMVLGLDLLPLRFPLPSNARFCQQAIESPEAGEWLEKELEGGQADCVLSDMSPNLSGIPFRDQSLSLELGWVLWRVAQKHLKPGGNFVLKLFPSEEARPFREALRKAFVRCHTVVPEATRKASSEIYLVCLSKNR